MTQLYTITATTNLGLVLEEVFTNEDDALAFEKRVDEILRITYSDMMADDPSLQVGFGMRKLHNGKLDDVNLYNGGWCEEGERVY